VIPCIIPARGGSKGIRHKNIVPVHGKPLIAWSVEQALASRLVSEVCVATDCQQIVDAVPDGAVIHWRSQESAMDDAPSEHVLREVVDARYRDADAVVFLQATSPMRAMHDIDSAIGVFVATGADSLFSARTIHGYTWEQHSTAIVPRYSQRRRRQDDEVQRLEENGSIYIFRPGVLEQYHNRLGGKVAVWPMHPLDSFQIDEPDDVRLIESLMEIRGYAARHAEACA